MGRRCPAAARRSPKRSTNQVSRLSCFLAVAALQGPAFNAYLLPFHDPMKKYFPTLLALLLGVLLTAGLLAAKAPAEGTSYEYVMIEKTGHRIYVTEGATKFEERKLKEEIKDFNNQGQLFKVVNEFEARGYEVYSTTQVGYTNSPAKPAQRRSRNGG
jgi:uncharacterized protein YxeA